MCEQSEVIYLEGDIVWVKLGACWWPGEVKDFEKMEDDIKLAFKKPPIAVVKFFQEDKFEYVKNINNIYKYNCRRKNDFIKKGLDLHRKDNSFMEKFPSDVVKAEKITNGDPNILTSEMFAPEQKTNYAQLFGTPSPKKTPKMGGGRGRPSLSMRKNTPKSADCADKRILHPRFRGKSDFEVTYLEQATPAPVASHYSCHICGFESTRLNVIVLHNKSHSSGYITNMNNKKPQKKYGRKVSKTKFANTTSIDEDIQLIRQGFLLSGSDSSESETEEIKEKEKVKQAPAKRQKTQKFKGPTPKKAKASPSAICSNLLADWGDSDADEIDVIEKKEKINSENLVAEKIYTGKMTSAKSVTEKSDTEKLDTKKLITETLATKKVENKKSEKISNELLADWDANSDDEKNIEVKKSDSNENGKDSCFDFKEEEEQTVLQKSPGRKIPRVIPQKRKSTENKRFKSTDLKGIVDDALFKNLIEETEVPEVSTVKPLKSPQKDQNDEKDTEVDDSTFKNLLEETAVPNLPSIDSLKSTQNFQLRKPIKSPDKKEENPEKTNGVLKESDSSTCPIPKKRFTRNFEDFEMFHNEQKVITDEAPPGDESPSKSNLEVSKLKTQLMTKLNDQSASTHVQEKSSSAQEKPRAGRRKTKLIAKREEIEDIQVRKTKVIEETPKEEIVINKSIPEAQLLESKEIDSEIVPELNFQQDIESLQARETSLKDTSQIEMETSESIHNKEMVKDEIRHQEEASQMMESQLQEPTVQKEVPLTQEIIETAQKSPELKEITQEEPAIQEEVSQETPTIQEEVLEKDLAFQEVVEEVPTVHEETIKEASSIEEEIMQEIIQKESTIQEDVRVPTAYEKTAKEPPAFQECSQGDTIYEDVKFHDEIVDKAETIAEEIVDKAETIEEEILQQPVIQQETVQEGTAIQEDIVQEASASQEDFMQKSPAIQEEFTQETFAVQEDIVQETTVIHDEVVQEALSIQEEIEQVSPTIQEDTEHEAPVIQEEMVQETPIISEEVAQEIPAIHDESCFQEEIVQEPTIHEEKAADLLPGSKSSTEDGKSKIVMDIADIHIDNTDNLSGLTTLAAVSELTGLFDSKPTEEPIETAIEELKPERKEDIIEETIQEVVKPEEIPLPVSPKKVATLASFSMDYSDSNEAQDHQIQKTILNEENMSGRIVTDNIHNEISTASEFPPFSFMEENVVHEEYVEKTQDKPETLESEMAKLTNTHPGAEEIMQETQNTSSSKLLEILTESKGSKKMITTPKNIIKGTNSNKNMVITRGKGLVKIDKNSKFVIKSAKTPKSNKPIILSEKIIKPMTETDTVSVKKVTSKRTYQDVEDIDTFIIQKPTKKSHTSDDLHDIILTPKSEVKQIKGRVGARGKPKIIEQTIIKAADVPGSESGPLLDDSMFDINSMPIVLSDQILTPESIENMPVITDMIPGQIVTTSVSTPTETQRTQTIASLKRGGTLQQVKLLNKPKIAPSQTESPPKVTATATTTTQALVKNMIPRTLGKNQKVYASSTKLLKNNPAVITQPGKPGKFIILPTTTASQTAGSKYTVGKRLAMKTDSPTSSKVKAMQGLPNEPTGNKIMIVTNSQGVQSRIYITPAQQKLFANKVPTAKITKGQSQQFKGNLIHPKSILTSKGTLVPVSNTMSATQKQLVAQAIMTSKGQIIPTQSQTLVTSEGQVLTPLTPQQLRSMKSDSKGRRPGQRIILPDKTLETTPKGKLLMSGKKTILLKGPSSQTYKKIIDSPESKSVFMGQKQLVSISSQQLQQAGVSGKQLVMTSKGQLIKTDKLTMSKSNEKVNIQRVSKTPTRITKGKGQMMLSPTVPKNTIQSPSVPPLAPITTQKKHVEIEHPKVKDIKEKEPAPVEQKHLIIQDNMGNTTTVTEGQILALPRETVDGQPQSYMLVTVDESGNLVPLSNEALMSLEPGLSLGGDMNNLVLQFDQPGVQPETPTIEKQETIQTEVAPQEVIQEATTGQQVVSIDGQQILLDQTSHVSEQQIVVDQQIPETYSETQVVTQEVVPEQQTLACNISTGETSQQLIITGDPESTQKFLASLTEGNTDLSSLLTGAEGNIIINTDGQQILLNTGDPDNQILLMPSTSEMSQSTIYDNQIKNQDILAAALADTDVFQQDSQDKLTSQELKATTSQLSPNSAMYPMNVGSVLETSLTLGSPIMTPLEVPSSKKIKHDLQSTLMTQVPSSLELPITITDPSIAQTVSQQVMLSNELQSNLELPISVSDTITSIQSSEMNSPNYVYSLPSLEESGDVKTCFAEGTVMSSENIYNNSLTGSMSMPLLTEEPEMTQVEHDVTDVESEMPQEEPEITHMEPHIPQEEPEVTQMEPMSQVDSEVSTVAPSIPSVEPEIPPMEHDVPQVEPKIPDMEPEIPHMEPEIPHMESEIPHMEPEILHMESEIPHMEPEIPHVEPEIPHVETEISDVEPNITHIESEKPHETTDILNAEPEIPHMETEIPQMETEKTSELDEKIELMSDISQEMTQLETEPKPTTSFAETLQSTSYATGGIQDDSVVEMTQKITNTLEINPMEDDLDLQNNDTCDSLSEPPPGMFDKNFLTDEYLNKGPENVCDIPLPGETIPMLEERKNISMDFNSQSNVMQGLPTDFSRSEVNSPRLDIDETSCEIPVQPTIITNLTENIEAEFSESRKRESEQIDESDSKRTKLSD